MTWKKVIEQNAEWTENVHITKLPTALGEYLVGPPKPRGKSPAEDQWSAEFEVGLYLLRKPQ